MPDTRPNLFYSAILANYPVTCVFTGKPVSYGGPSGLPQQHWAQRHQLCQQLGLPAEALRMPSQVHGSTIAFLEQPDWANTDAVIVDQPLQPVACQFADCVPVVLYAPLKHVGAVIHAGWRGTAQGIVPKTVQQLVTRYNVLPKDIIAVIGPAIGKCCFEVGPEVVEALAGSLGATDQVEPCLPSSCLNGLGPQGNPKVDVKQVNALQLRNVGVTEIELMSACTYCETDQLWSYRRGDTGRQVALLCLN